MTVNRLPDVDRIQGGMAEGSTPGDPERVVVQYTDHKGQWHELRIQFLDAMYLLNILKSIQLDVGYQMPDDPRES